MKVILIFNILFYLGIGYGAFESMMDAGRTSGTGGLGEFIFYAFVVIASLIGLIANAIGLYIKW